MDKLDPDGPLMIAAEQALTAYELAKADGWDGVVLTAAAAQVVDAYTQEQVRAARTAALEQACGAVCRHCADGMPHLPGFLEHGDGYGYRWHCHAAAIRALMSESEVTHG